MRRLLAVPIVLLLLLVFVTPVQASTLDVGPGEAFTSIQEAVNVASPGTTIFIHAGIYQESVIIPKNKFF